MELRGITTFNLAILVLFLGKWRNQRVPLLRRYNIPEPATERVVQEFPAGPIEAMLLQSVTAVMDCDTVRVAAVLDSLHPPC